MNRTFLLGAGALLVAGVTFMYLYTDAFIAEETGGRRVQVVVAARDISFGQPMRIQWLTTEDLPEAYLEDRHILGSEIRQLVGVPLATSVRAGEAVLRTDLSTLSTRQRTLSAEIPQGMRAVSLTATPESSHAGLLRPGDRVDVLLTVGDPRQPGSGRSVVVTQNVLVLSVGLVLQREWDDSRNRPRRDWRAQVSVLTDLEDAQRLVLSRRQGEMRLVLRSPGDPSILEREPEVHEADLFVMNNRQRWIRRFALAERPIFEEPPADAAP